LLDIVTKRATRVPVCMSDVDIWRLRFVSLELVTNKATSATDASEGQQEGGLAAMAYSILQTAMRCSFSSNEDYLAVMRVYCDTFRRALSAVVTVGAAAVDIVSYITTLNAALDFIENYLWSYFPQWVEGWVLFALYRARIEDGIIEDISCAVDGEINGTPVISRATEVWDRLLGSAHGRSYLVWKAVISWAIASRKEGDYVRKLCKKAVVITDNTAINFIHLDILSCGRSAIMYSQSVSESPQESLLNMWLQYEEENGTPESVQQVANRRFKVLGQTKPARQVAVAAASTDSAAQKRNSKAASKTEPANSKKRAAAVASGDASGDKSDSQQKAISSSGGGEVVERVPKRARKDPEHQSQSQSDAGRDATCMPAGPGAMEEESGTGHSSASVFVKNLAFSASEQDIREVFSDCGPVSRVEILTNTTGKSKGMAYVHFASAAAVSSAMHKHNAVVAGRPISVEHLRGDGVPGGQGDDGQTAAYHPTTIFVSKLPREVTEEGLRECFQKAVEGTGAVQECKIVRDKRSGHSKVRLNIQNSLPCFILLICVIGARAR
jgi:RNA recognition motif-containing protein